MATSAKRPKLNETQAHRLVHNLNCAQAAESLGLIRLKTCLPSLVDRLAVALKATRVHQRNADLACRHVLCAEALVEVLESRIADGRGRRGDARGAIVEEYGALVSGKVLGFSKRPAAERRRIQAAYPEVDLKLVGRAIKAGKLEPEFVAGVLEEEVNYRALLRTLRLSSRPRG